jgi:hypothetical protein
MAPHSTELSSDLVLKETDLDGAKHLSHESVSSLFHTWQVEALDDFHLYTGEDSPSSVRQVLEGLDIPFNILELPPLSQRPKRPLCTFMNFRGTRRDAEQLPSLEDESVWDETSYTELKIKVSLEVPDIEKSLKNDKQLNEYLAKFHRLCVKAKQLEKEIEQEEEQQRKKKQRLFY